MVDIIQPVKNFKYTIPDAPTALYRQISVTLPRAKRLEGQDQLIPCIERDDSANQQPNSDILEPKNHSNGRLFVPMLKYSTLPTTTHDIRWFAGTDWCRRVGSLTRQQRLDHKPCFVLVVHIHRHPGSDDNKHNQGG